METGEMMRENTQTGEKETEAIGGIERKTTDNLISKDGIPLIGIDMERERETRAFGT